MNFVLFVINMTIDGWSSRAVKMAYVFDITINVWACLHVLQLAVVNAQSHLFLVAFKLFLVLLDLFVALTTEIFQQLCDIRCARVIEVLLGTFLQSREWCDRLVGRMSLW